MGVRRKPFLSRSFPVLAVIITYRHIPTVGNQVTCSIYEYDPDLGCFGYENVVCSEMFDRHQIWPWWQLRDILDVLLGLFTPTCWRLWGVCVCSVLHVLFPSNWCWKGDKTYYWFDWSTSDGVDSLISRTASGHNWSSVNATLKRLKHLFFGELELLNDE